ncbi:hypothetical protein [Roseibacillus ishigakijimensis]|uniref:Uncharacterized protein n=1 Tax=Roseibacillus ishigakijimensis TaxID=454146 RepID=A0A934VLV3_9BACT|nr:hypothetical protein [Roseibacillus ishigakijimensis]MBK1833627.1 hypothetical protein [Roseibacillus ishigakijimensis]
MPVATGVIVSCAPVAPYSGNGPLGVREPLAPQSGPRQSQTSDPRLTSGQMRTIRERQAAQAAGSVGQVPSAPLQRRGPAGVGSGGSAPGNPAAAGSEVSAADLPGLSSTQVDYRYAIPVPGREGHVLEPFNHRMVDVRGVESGRLVYDERDPANQRPDGSLLPVAEMPHKFRVP